MGKSSRGIAAGRKKNKKKRADMCDEDKGRWEGVKGFTRCWVLGTLCHGHEGWYPPESDIEYLIGF